MALVSPAQAQVALERFWDATYIIDVRQDSTQSKRASSLGRGGYELSGGAWRSFESWYKPRWIEMRFDYMTQITRSFGLLWGVSTGERGPKYVIRPGFKLGAIVQAEVGPAFTVALLGTRMFGNHLSEKPCVADYGDLGVHDVNCRLAATTLPPAETLKYLISDKSPERYWLGLRLRLAY